MTGIYVDSVGEGGSSVSPIAGYSRGAPPQEGRSNAPRRLDADRSASSDSGGARHQRRVVSPLLSLESRSQFYLRSLTNLPSKRWTAWLVVSATARSWKMMSLFHSLSSKAQNYNAFIMIILIIPFNKQQYVKQLNNIHNFQSDVIWIRLKKMQASNNKAKQGQGKISLKKWNLIYENWIMAGD